DVRQIPIGESEDLPLLVCAVGGIVLGGPRLAEDVAEPSTGVYRVDDGLPVGDVGKGVWPDYSRVVEIRPALEGGDDLRSYGIVLLSDPDLTIISDIRVSLVTRVVMSERLPGLGRRRCHEHQREHSGQDNRSKRTCGRVHEAYLLAESAAAPVRLVRELRGSITRGSQLQDDAAGSVGEH